MGFKFDPIKAITGGGSNPLDFIKNPSSMFEDPLGFLMGSNLMGIGTGLVGNALGLGSFQAARDIKKLADLEADLIGEQSKLEAQRINERIVDTVDAQKAATIASGFLLEGSPLLHILETRREGAEDIANLEKITQLEQEFTRRGGKLRSQQSITEGTGRAIDIGFGLIKSGVIGG